MILLGAGHRTTAAGGGSDPYWANVELLITGYGTTGAQTFTDVSSTPKTLTTPFAAPDCPIISSAQSKFGSNSVLFSDRWYDLIKFPDAAVWDIGTGDFTVEAWVYPTSVAGARTVFQLGDPQTPDDGFSLYISSNGVYYLRSNTASSGGTMTANEWAHVAISRSSGTAYVCKAGSVVASAASAHNFSPTNYNGWGSSVKNQNNNFAGHMEQMRFTKGVGRYTGAYSVPTAPFPTA